MADNENIPAFSPARSLSPSPAPGEPARLGWRNSILLAALALAILLPGIQISLFDRDEGWYAQVSREMFETGDWLVPRYLGEVWLAKPPLLYWLVSTSYAFFGVGDWQARLVPVACSTLNVILLASLGARFFGRRAGLLGGVLFITAGLPALAGRLVLTDAPMITTLLMATILHYRAALRRPSVTLSAAYWLCIGLGVLAKGPAVLLFAGSFGLAMLVTGPRAWIRDWRFWAGLPLAPMLAAPWYVYVAMHAQDALVNQFIWYEIVSRVTDAQHRHGAPPGYYLLLSIAALLPWTAFVPGTLVAAFQRRREDRAAGLLLIWLGVPWIVLELVRSKLPHYILPCYLPLALLLGAELDRAIRSPRPWSALTSGERRGLKLWTHPLILAGALIAVVSGPLLGTSWGTAVCVLGAILAIGFATAQTVMKQKGIAAAAGAAAATMVGFYAALGLALLPALEPMRLSRNLAATLNAFAAPGEQVYLIGYEEPSTFLYLAGEGRVLPANVASRLETGTLIAFTEHVTVAVEAEGTRVRTLAELNGFNYVKSERVRLRVGRTLAPPSTTRSTASHPSAVDMR